MNTKPPSSSIPIGHKICTVVHTIITKLKAVEQFLLNYLRNGIFFLSNIREIFLLKCN